MLVSVIIPVYNGASYLRQAIDSVFNQTMPKENFEIIVMDDGSIDDTPKILKEYGRTITVITASKNHGVAHAINEGIQCASGEYIRILGADDEMTHNSLELMFDEIDRRNKKGEDTTNSIFYTNYHVINADRSFRRDFIEPDTHNDLFDGYYGSSSTSLIHRNVFEKCGLFDETLRSSEDYEFWLRATKIYDVKLVHIPIFGINYRRHPRQLTKQTGGENDEKIKDTIRKRIAKG